MSSPTPNTDDDRRDGTPDASAADHAHRDSEAMVMLGVFFIILGFTVLLGWFWEEPGPARAVCVAAGLALEAVAVGMIAAARFIRRRARRGRPGEK